MSADVEAPVSKIVLNCDRPNYGLGAFITNDKEQEMRIRTKDDTIMFEIINGSDRTEFEIAYNNREIMENLRKSFADMSAHATKNRAS